MKFTYTLNAHQVSPTKKAQYLHWGCRPVTGFLVRTDRIVRTEVRFTAPILFECEAESIIESDVAFTKDTKINPSKRPDIGCSISK